MFSYMDGQLFMDLQRTEVCLTVLVYCKTDLELLGIISNEILLSTLLRLQIVALEFILGTFVS